MATSFEIKSYAQQYLDDIFNLSKVPGILSKGNGAICHFNRLNLEQIKYLINENETLANTKHQGWHSLHYAALNPDFRVFQYIFKRFLDSGATVLPITEKEKKKIASGTSLTDFCLINDQEKVYAMLTTILKNPDENIKDLLFKSLVYKSPNCVKYFTGFLGEQAQPVLFKYYNNSYLDSHTNKEVYRGHYLITNGLAYNIAALFNYGIDINYRDEDNNSYFLVTLKILNTYIQEYNQPKRADIFRRSVLFFLKNEFTLDEKNLDGDSPRSFLVSILNNCSSNVETDLREIITAYDHKKLSHLFATEEKKPVKKMKI